MKIICVHIRAFGALRDARFEFGPGLNTVGGENESGKSTLAAFILFCLYGLDKAEREKYRPWSGEAIAGSLCCSLDGGARDIIIERRQTSQAKGYCAVTLDGGMGAERLPEYEDSPGEVIFGVGADTFAGTAFMRQGFAEAALNDKIRERLQNMADTGAESISADRLMAKLEDGRRELKHRTGSGGVIPALEREVARIEAALKRDAGEESLRSAEAEELSRLKEAEAVLTAEAEELVRRTASARTAAEVREAAELLALREKLKNFPERGPDVGLAERIKSAENAFSRAEAAAEAWASAESAEAAASAELQNGDGRRICEDGEFIAGAKPDIRLILAGMLCAVASFAGFLYPALFVFAAVGIMLIALGILRASPDRAARERGYADAAAFREADGEYRRRSAYADAARESARAAEARARELFAEFRKVFPYGGAAKYDGAIGLRRELARAGGGIAAAKKQYEAESAAAGERLRLEEYFNNRLAGRGIDTLREAAALLTYPGAEFREDLEKRLGSLRSKLSEIRERIPLLEYRLTDYKRSGESEKSLAAAREQLSEATLELGGYELAIGALREARHIMSREFAPALSAGASKWLKDITGGRYVSALPGNSMAGAKDPPGIRVDGIVRDAGYFSAGARDALYLSVRLALAELLFSEPPPIALDDPAARLDPRRRENLFRSLEEASRKWQVILFISGEGGLSVTQIPPAEAGAEHINPEL